MAQQDPLNDASGFSTREARSRFSELIGRAEYAKERIRLTRHGKTVAYLVPAQDIESLEAQEDRDRESLLADIQLGLDQLDRGEFLTMEELEASLAEHVIQVQQKIDARRAAKENG